MQLNTGATGQQVTAEDDGSLYSNIFGNGCYVLESGNQFKAEIQNNNRIKIYDGDALMQGRHVIIHANDSDVVIINNGTSKKNRKDLITIRYIKGNDGVEDAYLNVIQGTEVDGVPAAPEHVDGNILTGATTKDFPIYEVELQGINIIEVTPLFEVLGSIATTNSHLADSVAELNRKLQADNDWSTYSDNGWTLKYRHITANLISVEASRTSTGNNAAVVGNLVMAGIPFDVAFSQNVQCAMDVSGNIVGNGRARFADNNGLYLYTPGYGNPVTYTAFGIVSVK